MKTEGKYIKNFVEEKENNDVKTFYHFFFLERSLHLEMCQLVLCSLCSDHAYHLKSILGDYF